MRPPSRWLAPGAGTAMPPPPRPSGRGAKGPEGPPHSPPPPSHSGPRAGGGRPKKRRPGTPPEEAAAPGVRGHHGRGRRPHALPAAGRRRTDGAQDSANGAALSEAGPGKTGARTRAGGSPPPPPPPRRTDPLAANQATPDARGRPATPSARVYPGEARRRRRMAGRRPTGRRAGEAATPPLLPPRSPPPAWKPQERPSAPSEPRGRPPSPRRDHDAGGGDAAGPAHRAPQRPQPLPRGSRPQGEPTPACRSNARTKLWGRRTAAHQNSMEAAPHMTLR